MTEHRAVIYLCGDDVAGYVLLFRGDFLPNNSLFACRGGDRVASVIGATT